MGVPLERVKELVAALEVPFDPSQIEWRVTNTTKNQQPARGQVVPYADQRVYTDRLNALFTPAGVDAQVHHSYQCELRTQQRPEDCRESAGHVRTDDFGLGSHSATGEEWTDDDNAGTSAEAQAFKRACSCFGLGRYLYYFTGTWVDLDERKRPRTLPRLAGRHPQAGSTGFDLATRACQTRERETVLPMETTIAELSNQRCCTKSEKMEEVLGKRMYRGLLKTLARVWDPKDIHDVEIQQKCSRTCERLSEDFAGCARLWLGFRRKNWTRFFIP